ncbi:hypothetical protein [Desulfovibrio cuneatus]|uniref:hypothetical protein n=1 Tax=Desulfovibrio cuneatus TaxID=159728 RepID=UPI00048A0AAA|nr:hypothetical protein [Desulfovibrio cuneatus]
MSRWTILFSFAAWVFLLTNAHAAATSPQLSPARAAVFELCNSPDLETHLAAVLLSTDLARPDEIEQCLLERMKTTTVPWAKSIQLYALAKIRLEESDDLRFVEGLPSDQKNFRQLIDFESNMYRHPPSHILGYLMDLAERKERPDLQMKSRAKQSALFEMADGWIADFLQPQ